MEDNRKRMDEKKNEAMTSSAWVKGGWGMWPFTAMTVPSWLLKPSPQPL